MVDREKLAKVLNIVLKNEENLQPFVQLIQELIGEAKRENNSDLQTGLENLREAVKKYLELGSKSPDEAKNQWHVATQLAKQIYRPFFTTEGSTHEQS